MFDQFSIYDVMSSIGLDTSKIRSSSGYFDCPICHGKKKFNINPYIGHGGVCRCAKCAAGGDKLDLFILYKMNPHLVSAKSLTDKVYYKPSEDDRKEGMKELERELHLCRNTPRYLARIQSVQKAVEDTATAKPQIASPKDRNAVYTAFLHLLKLSTTHRHALYARGLNDDEIDQALFRSTPMFGRPQLAKKLIDQGLSLENIPGFFKNMKLDEDTGEVTEEWSVYCPDPGYFVPIRDKDGNIVSMQIRLNKTPTAENGKSGSKYLFFTSGRESLEGGIGAVSEVHVEMCAGAPKYVYITEGPIKGYVSHALYKRIYGKDDIILLCIVGTVNFSRALPLLAEILETYDIESVVEFYDLDKYTNEYVGRDRQNLEAAVKEVMNQARSTLASQYNAGKVKPSYVSFPKERYLGKGVDDHLLTIYQKLEETK